MTVLYLVRHAHAYWTPDENRPLSLQGHDDARRVADILSLYPVRAIHSSPCQRALQTIAPLAARLNQSVQTEPGLKERRLGQISGGDFSEAVEATWQDPSFAHPGGETHAAGRQRGSEVVRRLRDQHEGEHVVLSTHGNLMTLVLQTFDPAIGYAFWQALTMPDIYTIGLNQAGEPVFERLWRETPGSIAL